MRRNPHLDAVLNEIENVGGAIDRLDERKHWVIYWSFRGHKFIQVAPKTSRSASGIRNTVSEIRRGARSAA